ncbi:uncharacterized protein LOC144609299 [Rhinoraja longicauda]
MQDGTPRRGPAANYFTADQGAGPRLSEDCLRSLVIYSQQGREVGKISWLPAKGTWQDRRRGSRASPPPEDSPRRSGQPRRKGAAGGPRESRLNPCPACEAERAKLLEDTLPPLATPWSRLESSVVESTKAPGHPMPPLATPMSKLASSDVESAKALEGPIPPLANPWSKLDSGSVDSTKAPGHPTPTLANPWSKLDSGRVDSTKASGHPTPTLASPCSRSDSCAECTRLLEGPMSLLAFPYSNLESLCSSDGFQDSRWQPSSDSPRQRLPSTPYPATRLSRLHSPGWAKKHTGHRSDPGPAKRSPPPASKKHSASLQSRSSSDRSSDQPASLFRQPFPAPGRSPRSPRSTTTSPGQSETSPTQPAPGPSRPPGSHSRPGPPGHPETARRPPGSTPKHHRETSRSQSSPIADSQALPESRPPQANGSHNGSRRGMTTSHSYPTPGPSKSSSPYQAHPNSGATRHHEVTDVHETAKQQVHSSHHHHHRRGDPDPTCQQHSRLRDHAKPDSHYPNSGSGKTTQSTTPQSIPEPGEATQPLPRPQQVNNGPQQEAHPPGRSRNHTPLPPSPSDPLPSNLAETPLPSPGSHPVRSPPTHSAPPATQLSGGAATPQSIQNASPKRPPEEPASPPTLVPAWLSGEPPAPSPPASDPRSHHSGPRSPPGSIPSTNVERGPAALSPGSTPSQPPSVPGPTMSNAEPVPPLPTSTPNPPASSSHSGQGQVRDSQPLSPFGTTSPAKASGRVEHLSGSQSPAGNRPANGSAVPPSPPVSDNKRHHPPSPGLSHSGPEASLSQSGETKRNSSTSPMFSISDLRRISEASSPSQPAAGSTRDFATSPMTSNSGLTRSRDETAATRDSMTSPIASGSARSGIPNGSSSRAASRPSRGSPTPPRVSPKTPAGQAAPDPSKRADAPHVHSCPSPGEETELQTLGPVKCANASHSHCLNSQRPVPVSIPVKCQAKLYSVPCPLKCSCSSQPPSDPCAARCPHYMPRATSCANASHSHCSHGQSRAAKCPAASHAVPPPAVRCSNPSHSHCSPGVVARSEPPARPSNPCPVQMPRSVPAPVKCSNPSHSHGNPCPAKHWGPGTAAAAPCPPARCPHASHSHSRPATPSNASLSHCGGPKKNHEHGPPPGLDRGRCPAVSASSQPLTHTGKCSNGHHSHLILGPLCNA